MYYLGLDGFVNRKDGIVLRKPFKIVNRKDSIVLRKPFKRGFFFR